MIQYEPTSAEVPNVSAPLIYNLLQLEAELKQAGVNTYDGLIVSGNLVFVCKNNHPAQFDANQAHIAQNICDAHVGMRPKTDDEYQLEYQTADLVRQVEIREQMLYLIPRERVPMTEMDFKRLTGGPNINAT